MTLMQPEKMLSATYPGIVAARVDRAGNLRLFERGRFGLHRQRAFHPAGEWDHLLLDVVAVMVMFDTTPRPRP